jgi:ADP-ribose pyrophosphatase YjhB (NUDIX family)
MTSTLDHARKLLALAQSGLHFSPEEYDRERYREIVEIATELLAHDSGVEPSRIKAAWFIEDGYATPKIDVRGFVVRDGAVLLVRERTDGRWSLPGGWADVNEGPRRAVEKEIEQESGFIARALRVAAVYDRTTQRHPPSLHHAWKIFFICEITGGERRASYETTDVNFFALDALPELSLGRTTEAQIRRMFEHYRNPEWPADFD